VIFNPFPPQGNSIAETLMKINFLTFLLMGLHQKFYFGVRNKQQTRRQVTRLTPMHQFCDSTITGFAITILRFLSYPPRWCHYKDMTSNNKLLPSLPPNRNAPQKPEFLMTGCLQTLLLMEMQHKIYYSVRNKQRTRRQAGRGDYPAM